MTVQNPALKKGMTVMIPRLVKRESGVPCAKIPEDASRYDYKNVDIWRETNEEDRLRWEASDASKGMNDAGETRLQSPTQYLHREEGDSPRLWEVVRARVAAPKGWGRKESGCAQVRSDDGVLWYVSRAHCYPVRLG